MIEPPSFAVLYFQIEIFILQFNFEILTWNQASAGRDDIRERGLSRSGMGGDEDVRGRHFLNFHKTP